MVLPIHLPEENDVLYNEKNDVDQIETRLLKISKLEAWFNLNQIDPDTRSWRYSEIPEHYVWYNGSARWVKRSQMCKTIGCLVEVSPSSDQMEKYFLRVLLKRIKGPKSFEDLLTLEDGYKCQTYREVCQRKNWLIDSGGEFERSLEEAELKHHPNKFRKLFSLICCVAMEEDMAQIEHLWKRFRKSLMADFLHAGMERYSAIAACIEKIKIIVDRCRPGIALSDIGICSWTDDDESDIISENEDQNTMFDIPGVENNPVEKEKFEVSSLNRDQKVVFLRVLNAVARICNIMIPLEIYEDLGNDVTPEQIVNRAKENVFYLDGPGGTGKTYLYNTIINAINKVMRKDTIAVAWTGIAANILIGGTTVHRSFRLPLTLSKDTTCGYDMESQKSKFIRDSVALIIWDEAPMTPKLAVESVNRYMMDIMRRGEPFGGKCFLFGGDFRQILPVVLGAYRQEIIAQSLKASCLWRFFTQLRLRENMRIKFNSKMSRTYNDLGNRSFADWILAMGDGTLPFQSINRKAAPKAPDNLIEIPKRFQVSTLEELIDFVYEGNFASRENGSRGILCPTNAAVNELNNIIIEKICDEREKIYLSEDSYNSAEEDNFRAPIDLLNSIDVPSLPPHELVLKRGAIVMLLRNLDVDEGECNGSRMRVVNLGQHLIECELLTGQKKGERVLLPRLKMKAQNTILPKEIIRHQFPIRVAYALTINKSQGQTLKRVGVCLRRPCFTHGQLYVAFSRVGDIDGVKVYIEESGKQGSFKFRGRRRFTSNIVFEKILEKDDRRQTISTDDADEVPFSHQSPEYRVQSQDPHTINELDNSTLENQEKIEEEENDDEFWKGSVPYRTRSQLHARISVYDRPGTSGINAGKNFNEDSHETMDETSDESLFLFENKQKDRISTRPNLMSKENECIDDDDYEFWKGAVPYRTTSQLQARVSTYNRPGTSGIKACRDLNILSHGIMDESSESDSD